MKKLFNRTIQLVIILDNLNKKINLLMKNKFIFKMSNKRRKKLNNIFFHHPIFRQQF